VALEARVELLKTVKTPIELVWQTVLFHDSSGNRKGSALTVDSRVRPTISDEDEARATQSLSSLDVCHSLTKFVDEVYDGADESETHDHKDEVSRWMRNDRAMVYEDDQRGEYYAGPGSVFQMLKELPVNIIVFFSIFCPVAAVNRGQSNVHATDDVMHVILKDQGPNSSLHSRP